MDVFKVIKPSGHLAPFIKEYWFLRLEDVVNGSQRIIPSGNIMLIFRLGSSDTSCLKNKEIDTSGVCGQFTDYIDLTFTRAHFISVVFKPTGAMALFKIPINELFHRIVPVNLLGDSQLCDLEKRLVDNRYDIISCVNLLETFFTSRMKIIEELSYKRMEHITNLIFKGEHNIDTLSQAACIGYKQFKRVFSGSIGINPKVYLRILRFQRTLYAIQQNREVKLTQLAEEFGYYDKSHLIREFKEYSGLTPKEYIAVRDPVYSPYHASFRCTFINNP